MKERLTITLDHYLLQEVKNKADELQESVSQIIEKAVKSWRKSEMENKLKQYYLNASEENDKIIKEAEPMINELWEENNGS
jgi:hypothetical protein